MACQPPPAPENSHFEPNEGPFKAGDVLQFLCHKGFMPEGQPIIVCQEDGTWSKEPPKCEYCNGTFLRCSICLYAEYSKKRPLTVNISIPNETLFAKLPLGVNERVSYYFKFLSEFWSQSDIISNYGKRYTSRMDLHSFW